MTASQRLAAFAAALRYDDLPGAVVAAVKRHLLDTIGVALAAASQEFAGPVVRAVRELGGDGTAAIIGRSETARPVWAALANGALAHGLDFDDTHTESVVHVSAAVAPAALAAAAARPCEGRALITALALGMETNVRLGLVARGAFHDRGFHPTGICGTFAAALVASVLSDGGRGDVRRHADALGLAASTAAGSLEFLSDGSWAKRLHGGWAAHAGISVAALAGAGFSGPAGALDGRFGLYRSHLGAGPGLAIDLDTEALTRQLGSTWHMLDTALKPYPCCHFNHAFIDAAAALRADHGIEADDIESVQCWIADRQMPIVCEPRATKLRPQTDYDAKFSLPYAVACMFARGHVDIDDFDAPSIGDAALLRLAEKVECLSDPDSQYPARFGGRLAVRLRDGRVLEHAEPINRGCAERPLTASEVERKFTANATRTLPSSGAERIATGVAGLDAAAGDGSRRVAELLDALRLP